MCWVVIVMLTITKYQLQHTDPMHMVLQHVFKYMCWMLVDY